MVAWIHKIRRKSLFHALVNHVMKEAQTTITTTIHTSIWGEAPEVPVAPAPAAEESRVSRV